MKILIYSPLFYPSLGGLETMMFTLSQEFINAGHVVKVVTQTQDPDEKTFSFHIIRRPSAQTLVKLVEWCDIFFQGCVSLKGLWPLWLVPRPLVITHQTWYQRANGRISWQDYFKKRVAKSAINISVSKTIAQSIPGQHTIIPNSYCDDLFNITPDVSRSKELVYLGRLVSDKGVDLLLDALSRLKGIGLTPQLTIIGNGPEEIYLHRKAQDSGIGKQVRFVGTKQGKELVELLNSHQIMVVPSRWKEPFGIVALEGIACGCIVVGSEGGGLKDAIGSCGITFPNGDTIALTNVLADLLRNPRLGENYRANATTHLARHKKGKIAQEYLQVFEQAVSEYSSNKEKLPNKYVS